MQYYVGHEDFGCTYIESGGTKLRSFKYQSKDHKNPSFKCVLINKRCHKDSDCKTDRIGGLRFQSHCYGSSCYEYTNPLFGSKAKGVAARRTKKGSAKKGINLSCKYVPFLLHTARCETNKFGPKIIWDGRRKSQKILKK